MTMIISGSTGLEFPDGSDQTTAFTNVSPTFTGTVAVEALTASGNVNFDSNTLFVDSVNNEVGIGTSSPSYKLHVVQSSGVAAGFDRADGSPAIIDLRTSGTTRGYLGASTSVPFIVYNASPTELMRIDNSGNLGLGVTPSAWSGHKAIQFAVGSGFVSSSDSAYRFFAGTNAYFNGTNWIYKASTQASLYEQADSKHSWYTAPSGTAGNAITFTQAMTLTAGGDLGLGTTSPVTYSSSGKILAVVSTAPSLSSGGIVNYDAQTAAQDVGGVITLGGQDGSIANRSFAAFKGGKENATSGNYASYASFATRANGGVMTERFRIGSSGQLGIGGANYGTAGQVLKSNGSGSAPSWGSGGKVLQVLQAVSTTQQSTSSRSMIDVSGMSVSITPSSTSSKILVIVDLKGGAGYQGYIGTQLLRNATIIYSGVGTGQFLSFTYTTSGDAEGRYSVYQLGGTYLDSPATTSAITYKLQYQASVQGTAYINRSEAQDSAAGCTASSITVMEIAG